MRDFLRRGIILFVTALIVVVVVFFVVIYFRNSLVFTSTLSMQDLKEGISAPLGESKGEQASTTSGSTVPALRDIPLKDIPLDTFQKELLSKAGVDTETFIVTVPMLQCGVDELGQSRVEAITAGAAPTVKEFMSLIPCLRATS